MSEELGIALCFAGSYLTVVVGMIIMAIQEWRFNKTNKTE